MKLKHILAFFFLLVDLMMGCGFLGFVGFGFFWFEEGVVFCGFILEVGVWGGGFFPKHVFHF